MIGFVTWNAVCNAASDWPRTFFIPKVILFSISLLFWKQMLLLASSREVLHGRGVARGGHGGAFARPSLIFAPPSRFIYLKYIM